MSKGILSPFAHLGRRSAAGNDPKKDDQAKAKKKAEGEDENDEFKDLPDEDEDAPDPKDVKAGKDDDDDDKKDGDDKAKKAKKAKASDDEDDEADAGAKAARSRERGRIRAILLSDAGKADPVAAVHVALDTSMPRAEAVGLLTAMSVGRSAEPAAPAGNRDGLRSRMEAVHNPQVGADGGTAGGPTMAERIIAAGKKRRNEA